MSTLTILVMIVAGVAVAYLLEAWSEGGTSESTVRTGGVPNSVLSKHLGSPFPDGFYTEYSKEVLNVATTGFSFVLLFCSGLLLVFRNLPL